MQFIFGSFFEENIENGLFLDNDEEENKYSGMLNQVLCHLRISQASCNPIKRRIHYPNNTRMKICYILTTV